MNEHAPGVVILCGGVATLLASCASAPEPGPALPFHVALAPVFVEQVQAMAADAGAPADVVLALDAASLSRALSDALRGSVAKITLLEPGEPAHGTNGGAASGNDAWLDQAQAKGADLILDVTFSYDPTFATSLNDRFWLNLPLFALGGPATWFVADRSYRFHARLDAQLFDVATASAPSVRALDAGSRLLRLDRQIEEASLSFLERASGVHYLLSLVVPAGFVAPRSDSVPEELRDAVTSELCAALVRALRERSEDLARGTLVAFHPSGVHTVVEGGARFLVGEFVLEVGNVSELGRLRYRFDSGSFVDAAWGEVTLEARSGRTGSLRHYPFRIALGDATDTVQLEVEQADVSSSKRTFTYPIAPPREER